MNHPYTTSVDEAAYLDDGMMQAAVERKFEMIGEAPNRIRRIEQSVVDQISDHQRIIAFRNVPAHGYDIADPALVWAAVQNHLPILKADVKRLLEG